MIWMSTLLNIDIIFFFAEFAALFGLFSMMIDRAGKASRESHMVALRALSTEDFFDRLIEFIDGEYCQNGIVRLKMEQGIFLILVICSGFFVISGYYSASSFVPTATEAATAERLSTLSVAAIESVALRLPVAQYLLAFLIQLGVLILSVIVAIHAGFPQDMLRLIDPTRFKDSNGSNRKSASQGK